MVNTKATLDFRIAFLCKELFCCSRRGVVILFPRLDICIPQNIAL